MSAAVYGKRALSARACSTGDRIGGLPRGWGDTCTRLNEKAAKGDWGGMASEITDEMLEVFAVTARWDDVAAKVRARYTGILDRVALYLPFRPGADTERWRSIVRAFA